MEMHIKGNLQVKIIFLIYALLGTSLQVALCFMNCEKGSFILGNMTKCHPWLACDEIRSMIPGDLIGFGAVKQVYQATWRENVVAYNMINNIDYADDFMMGLENLKGLSPSEYVVQLIGFCDESNIFITEYHPLGSALNSFKPLCERLNLDLKTRFLFSISYVKILAYLHNSPKGKLVMCDSNTLNKTLEQYLITSSLKLVLNDVEALPEVGKNGVVCGHKELVGTFIAPEQKWLYPEKDFEEEEMTSYNEKSDIWKIPSICNYFLGNDEDAKVFRYHLYPVHAKCRQKDPYLRPSAADVLEFYESLLDEYFDIKSKNPKQEL